MKYALLSLLLILWAAPVRADNWPQWRGPSFDGVATGSGYPTKWSDKENIIWKIPVPNPPNANEPAWGTSTPAIWEDRAYMTTESDGKNALVCVALKDGKQMWLTAFGSHLAARNRKASGSNPSASTDGKRVYGYFKSGEFVCTDTEGKTLWRKDIPKEFGDAYLQWDLGTSPIIVDDAIIIARMHRENSYVIAFNAADGEMMWKVDRTLDAPRESNESYTTPILYEHDGQKRIVIVGGDHITAHAVADGKELWRVGGLNPQQRSNYRSIASPVVHAGMVFAPYARGDTLTAVRLGGSGDVTKSHVAWVNYDFSSDVPTPTAANGRVFICTDRGTVACLDAKSGDEKWNVELPRSREPYSASPILADGHVYVTREDGRTFVVSAEAGQVESDNPLFERTYASPVFVDGKIYLRTSEFLFCIGNK